MSQNVYDFIKTDATFYLSEHVVYNYVYVDVENNNEEILLATYFPVNGDFQFENEIGDAEYLDRPYVRHEIKHYSNTSHGPAYTDVLIYSVSEDEMPETKLDFLVYLAFAANVYNGTLPCYITVTCGNEELGEFEINEALKHFSKEVENFSIYYLLVNDGIDIDFAAGKITIKAEVERVQEEE